MGLAGSVGNFANFQQAAGWKGQDGNVTSVGTNGGPGPYGTFDMSGNVLEWNDMAGGADTLRASRGGNWHPDCTNVSSTSRVVFSPNFEKLTVSAFVWRDRCPYPCPSLPA